MSTKELRQHLHESRLSPNTFHAVLPCDGLDHLYISHLPAYLIINSDTHYGKGKHWFVIHITRDLLYELYDPLGCSSLHNRHVITFIKRLHLHELKSTTSALLTGKVRHDNHCGYYCLHYILRKEKKWNTECILLETFSVSNFSSFVRRIIEKK